MKRWLPLAALLLGCSGETLTAGLAEPLRVNDAQFREGDLPGQPPLTAADVNAGVMAEAPNVSGLMLNSAVVPQGEVGRNFSGAASADSVAIGVRFADLGSGYWLVPTGSPDTVNEGALEWRFRAAFGYELPSGKHQLLLAGIDAQGRSGTQLGVSLCVLPEVPDNGNACSSETAPPELVVSLGWSAAVDLDLRVVTPTGKIVDPKHPSTADKDEKGKLDPQAAGVGILDHDAFANCSTADGRGRESLVFQTTPAPGTYLVYAGLFDACGESGVSFDISLHTPSTNADGNVVQVETYRKSAQLSAVQADAGSRLGTYITSFEVQ